MSGSRRRIWDCFVFGDEVDVLEFRLKELYEHVDRFVVVEGDRTYAGQKKPSYFAEHMERFEPFMDKITHVVAPLSVEGVNRFQRENEQHRGILSVFDEVAENDLVIAGDVDEIPFDYVLERLRDGLEVPLRLEMVWAVYYANWVLPRRFLEGPFAFRRSHIGHQGIDNILGTRPMAYDPTYHEQVLPSGGWHISSLGGASTLNQKFASYIDPSFDNELDRSLVHLGRCLQHNVHYEGRWLMHVLQEEEFNPLVRRMYKFRPAWFDLAPTETRMRSRAYRAFTWVRRSGRVPERFIRFIDEHPGAVTGAGAPIFAAVDALLQLRRTIVKPIEHWKSWEYTGVDGKPLDGVAERTGSATARKLR